MNSTNVESADSTALSESGPGSISIEAETETINGATVPETGAPHAAHFQQPAVSCATSAESLSFCMVPTLASAFLASLPPGPEQGTSAPPGEPVRLCMVPVLAQAFLSLRTARLHVTSNPQQSFVILVLSTGATASAEPVTWKLDGGAVLEVSGNTAVWTLLSKSALRELVAGDPLGEVPGGQVRPELSGPQPSPSTDPSSAQQDKPFLPWKLLAQHDFRRYFLGSLVTNLGTWLQSTAQVLLAYRLTHSFFAVGLISSAQFAGMLVVSPWAPVLVTKFSSRAVLIGTQCASATIAIAMAWCYAAGALSLWPLALGALGLGFSYALALPVQTALVQDLVHEADVAKAVRMNSVSYNAGRALAPALSVLVIASLGPESIFIVNAASFVMFALILRRVSPIAEDTSLRMTLALAYRQAKHKASDTRPSVQRSRGRVMDGLVIALHNRRILLLLAIVAAVTLADDPIMVLSPALAHAKLHVSSEWSGYFIAALGWGCVFGSVVPASTGDKGAKRASRYAAFSLLALGASVFVFAQGFSRMVTLIAAIAAGIAGLFAGTAAQSALLRHQKDTGASATTVAGVAALWAIAWAGTKPFASLLDGLLAGHVGMVRTSGVLIFPAITVAFGELLLPRKWKKFINKIAGMITEFITPKLISAANAVLLADFPPLPQAQAPIGYLPPNQKSCHQASFMTARPTEMPAAQRSAIGHVVAGRPIEIVEAHVTQGARIEHSQPAAL